MRIRSLRRALANLNAEAECIARDNPAAALRVVDAITTAVERLRNHTGIGRPGRVIGTRELVIPGTPYIVPYRAHGQEVHVLRVFHAARKWPTHL